ncbi:10557_t:CDS:2, partial [Racocetra fulgida]
NYKRQQPKKYKSGETVLNKKAKTKKDITNSVQESGNSDFT